MATERYYAVYDHGAIHLPPEVQQLIGVPDRAPVEVEVGQNVIMLRFRRSRVDELAGIFPPDRDTTDLKSIIRDAVEEHVEHVAREGLPE